MHFPALLLLRAWFSSPERAVAGILGVALFVWSVVPLARRPFQPSITGEYKSGAEHLAELFEGIRSTWREDRIRASLGLVGFIVFLWSAWPIATMP